MYFSETERLDIQTTYDWVHYQYSTIGNYKIHSILLELQANALELIMKWPQEG